MWTTNPELASLLANPDDGYLYKQRSSKKTNWKCPECGEIIYNKCIEKIHTNGLTCPRCSDGISFPEKLMYGVLCQLKIVFIRQMSCSNFNWCGLYRYDFYLPEYNAIIEMNGEQHYKGWMNRLDSLRKIKENDKNKYELAVNNGIQEYIIIDCKVSKFEYIKENILNCKLSDLFDLNSINWNDCIKYANSSFVKEASYLWNNGIKNAPEIARKLKVNHCTAIEYLKRGAEAGWCDYNSNHQKKMVICITTGEVFESIADAAKKYSSAPAIYHCCNKKYTYAGKSQDGKKLQWEYYKI